MEMLATRREYNKARGLILRHLQENGPSKLSDLGIYQRWGLPADAIQLALEGMTRDGVIDELYTTAVGAKGRRVKWYAMPGQKLPEGTMRIVDALALIGD